LVIGPAPGEGPPPEVLVSGEGVHELDPSGLALHVDIIPGGGLDPRKAAPRPTIACLDADRLRFPLLVRPVRPGDRFHPLGAPGRKKMQDFLVDEKVPVEERTRVRVLESGGEIAWVLGMRIDERFKVREGTRRVAVLRLSQGGGKEG
jgi:tRNA(Ile)-lysidine synthetase-like protein